MSMDSKEAIFDYDIFISYSRKDIQFAGEFEKAIEAYKPPPDLAVPQRYLRVFRDEEDFTGTEYNQSLKDHLNNSAYLIVICSPDARKSRYVSDEIRLFADIHGTQKIIPLLHSGIPNNEAAKEQENFMAFPEALCELLKMPLSADYRGFDFGKDKINKGSFKGPWFTLLSNIYGLSRSEIEQREWHRKKRKRLTWASAIAAIIISLTVAFIIALVNYYRAEKQKNIADSSRLAAQAELLRQQSPDLLERSLLLAMESMEIEKSVEAEETFRKASALLLEPVAKFEGRAVVEDLAFSPKGDALAIGYWSGDIRILNPKSGIELANMSHDSKVSAIEFTPNGDYLVSSSDESVRLWKVNSGELIMDISPSVKVMFTGHIFDINPDGKILATSDGDKRIDLWDIDTRTLLVDREYEEKIENFSFSPVENVLTVATIGGRVHLFDLSTNISTPYFKEQFHDAVIAYSPDGRFLAIGRSDGTVKVKNLTDLSEIATLHHRGEIRAVEFAPDGRHLITGSGDQTAIVWQVQTGKELFRLPQGTDVHEIEISPDGYYLGCVTYAHSARIWDLRTGIEIARICQESSINNLVFCPDGSCIVSGGGHIDLMKNRVVDPSVRVWRFGRPRFFSYYQHEGSVDKISFSPRSLLLASSGWDKRLKVMDAMTGREEALIETDGRVFDVQWNRAGNLIAAREEHGLSGLNRLMVWDVEDRRAIFKSNPDEHLSDFSWHPNDANVISAVSIDGSVRIFDVSQGREITRYRIENSNDMQYQRYGVRYRPDGNGISVWSNNGMRILDADSGSVIATLQNLKSPREVTWSPNSEFIVFVENEEICIFDPDSHKEYRWTAHKNVPFGIKEICLSPDSKHLATMGNDAVVIWEMTTSKEVARIRYEGTAYGFAFSSDGQRLNVVYDNNVLRVLETRTGNEVTSTSFTNTPLDIAVSHDDRFLAVTDTANGISILFLPINEMVKETCTRLTRNLTTAELQQYLDKAAYKKTCDNLPMHPSYVEDMIERLVNSGNVKAFYDDVRGIQPDIANPSKNIKTRKLAASGLLERADQQITNDRIEDALATVSAAEELDANLKMPPDLLNRLCWQGSLNGFAGQVLAFCDTAVELADESNRGYFQDSRGLALALTGKYADASKDFKDFIKWSINKTEYDDLRYLRESWLTKLDSGINPFDRTTIDKLRKEYF